MDMTHEGHPGLTKHLSFPVRYYLVAYDAFSNYPEVERLQSQWDRWRSSKHLLHISLWYCSKSSREKISTRKLKEREIEQNTDKSEVSNNTDLDGDTRKIWRGGTPKKIVVPHRASLPFETMVWAMAHMENVFTVISFGSEYEDYEEACKKREI